VAANRVNLREGPGTDTPALALLNDGDEVAVLATDGGWLRVKTESGLEGWIAARFVAGEDG
jgi:uncharacterized protein YgiM (DUF1202 family)